MEVLNKEKIGQQSTQKINGYPTEFGTVNAEIGKSFFLSFGGWVRPLEGEDLNMRMKSFERKLRFWVDDASNQLLSGKLDPKMPIIKIVDYSDTGFASNAARVNNSYTYFNIELNLYFKEKQSIRDGETKDLFLLLCYSLVDYFRENRELSFQPSRK